MYMFKYALVCKIRINAYWYVSTPFAYASVNFKRKCSGNLNNEHLNNQNILIANFKSSIQIISVIQMPGSY